jgi:hypothetical protein
MLIGVAMRRSEQLGGCLEECFSPDLVAIVHAGDELLEEEAGRVLWQPHRAAHVLKQLAGCCILHHSDQVRPRHEDLKMMPKYELCGLIAVAYNHHASHRPAVTYI